MTKKKGTLDQVKLKEVSLVIRALSHPLRMQILQFIDKKKVTNVYHIYSNLKIEQSITSQQLKILRVADLVHSYREGKFIYYSLNYDKIGNAAQVLAKYAKRL